MHLGNLIALAIVAILVAGSVVANFRARRARRAALRHRPAPGAGLRNEDEAKILIGNVAADGARSSLG